MKKILCAVLAAICLISVLAGCGGSDAEAVPVVSVGIITGYTTQVSSFAGKVVSGQTEKIENDNERKIAETYVEEGDMVQAGDVLFEYDLEDMQLSLEKLQLEYEQMQQNISDKQSTISSLQSQMSSLSASDQASYTLQISALQTDIRELEYNSTLKQQDIETMQSNMENAEVCASVSGRVMSVKDLDSAGADSTDPYITIMDVSAYRVEGQISELNIRSVYAGMPVIVRSRVDSSVVWNGTIESIDLENPQSNNSADMYYESDDYTSSSKYTFYVQLDNTDDMILGQHVYIEPDYGQEDGLYLDESYIVIEDDGSAYVWAAGKNTLEKRDIVLGEYSADSMSYKIEEGLDYDDYIAFPSDDLKEGRKIEKYDEDVFGGGDVMYDDYIDYADYEDDTEDGFYDEESEYFEEYEEYAQEDMTDDLYASDTDAAEG